MATRNVYDKLSNLIGVVRRDSQKLLFRSKKLVAGGGVIVPRRTHNVTPDAQGNFKVALECGIVWEVIFPDLTTEEFFLVEGNGSDILLSTLIVAGNPQQPTPVYAFLQTALQAANDNLETAVEGINAEIEAVETAVNNQIANINASLATQIAQKALRYDAAQILKTEEKAQVRANLELDNQELALDLPRVRMYENGAGGLTGTFEYAVTVVVNNIETPIYLGLSQAVISVTNAAVGVAAEYKVLKMPAARPQAKLYRRQADANGVFSNNWVLLSENITPAFSSFNDTGAAGTPVAAPVISSNLGARTTSIHNSHTIIRELMQTPKSILDVRPSIWFSSDGEIVPDNTNAWQAYNYGTSLGVFRTDARINNRQPIARHLLVNGAYHQVWHISGNKRFYNTGLAANAVASRLRANGAAALNWDAYSTGVSFLLVLKQAQHIQNYETLFRIRNKTNSAQNLLFTVGSVPGRFFVSGDVGTTAGAAFFPDENTAPISTDWTIFTFTYDFASKTIKQRTNGVTWYNQVIAAGDAWINDLREMYLSDTFNTSFYAAEVVADDKAWSETEVVALERDFKRKLRLSF